MTTTGRGAREFVVECFLPGVDESVVRSAAGRAMAAADEARRGGRPIAYEGAILVPGDEVVLHLFRSASAVIVEEVSAAAALAYERVVDAVRVGGCRDIAVRDVGIAR